MVRREHVGRVVAGLRREEPVEGGRRIDRPRVDSGLGEVQVASPAVPWPDRRNHSLGVVPDGGEHLGVRREAEREEDERLLDGVQHAVIR